MLWSTWSQHNFWTNQDRCLRLVPYCCKLNSLSKVLIFFDVCMTFLSRSSGNRQWCHKWPISITTTITIFKKMHFSKIFPTKYFAVCFFEILEACCNLKQGSLVMSLPFFFWGVSDMGGYTMRPTMINPDLMTELWANVTIRWSWG